MYYQFRRTIGVANCYGLNNWMQCVVNPSHYTMNSLSSDAFTIVDIGRSNWRCISLAAYLKHCMSCYMPP